MEVPDTFSLLSLTMDPQTKVLSSPNPSLTSSLTALNALHRTLLTLETPNQVPPPPVPVAPKRSQALQKLKDSGNVSFRKAAYTDAIRMYSLGVEMALGRPLWEPQGLVREEVSALYANRAQAWMAQREWAEGLVDAELAIEAKRVGNAKAWWRRGKCLVEMGRLDEAEGVVREGIEVEEGAGQGSQPGVGDLRTLGREIEALLARR